jgi:hypothetical protein
MPARGREETANEASRLLTQDEATSETSRVSGARNLSSWSAGCDQRACGENERSPRLIDVTSRDAPAVRWCARTWCADARVPTFESLQRVLSSVCVPSRSAHGAQRLAGRSILHFFFRSASARAKRLRRAPGEPFYVRTSPRYVARPTLCAPPTASHRGPAPSASRATRRAPVPARRDGCGHRVSRHDPNAA